MRTKFSNNSFISLVSYKSLNHGALRAMLVMLLFVLGIGNAWGGGGYKTHLRTCVDTEDTGKGLVYANTSKTASVTDNSYTNVSVSDAVTGENGKNQSLYGWAKPARGWAFAKWVGYDYSPISGTAANQEGAAKPQANTGTADLIYAASWSGNAGNEVWRTAKATWSAATGYTVTYKQPIGGTYSVQYSYLTVNTSTNKFTTSTESATLTPSSEDWTPTGVSAEQDGLSYAADVVTLTSSAANFEAWYEDGVSKSTGSSYTYPITKTANVSAVFKNAVVAAPEEVSVSTNSITVAKAASVVFDVETTGTWAADASGFTVTFQSKDGPGDFAVTSKSYSEGKLTVNFTYTANDWVGTSIEMVVTPAYGTGATAVIRGIAEELIDYEACVLVGGEIQRTGTLAAMLEYANTLDNTPTLQLTQNVTAAATLQFKKTMILDLNNKTLSATAVDKLLLVKGNSASDKVVLTITDNSFAAAGEMQLTRSASATSVGVEIADENKLTLQKGILTISNNTAAAQGVHISASGNLLMQGGKVITTANNDARGVYAEAGFVTMMSGSIEVSAGTNAYGLWSAGQSNITDATIDVKTTTGTSGYGFYVNGGVTTLTEVATTVSVKTAGAGGGFVKAGRLNVNGGSIAVTAETSEVYGVYVVAGATANIQQNAIITAQATGASGTKVFGINNLGTVSLTNVSVTVTSPTTDATAVNTATSAVSTTIEGGTYRANTTGGTAYGLHHQYGALNVDGATFAASAAGDNVYGAYLSESATLANTTLKGETTGAAKYAYGVIADTEGKTISLTNCDIEAKSITTYAYAICSKSNLTANDGSLLAKTADGANAFGVYAEKGNNTLTNIDATVEAYTTGAYGVLFDDGTLSVNGGTYDVIARQATASALANSEAYGVKVADGKTATLKNATFIVKASNSAFSQNAYGAFTGSGTINSTACTYAVTSSQKAYGVYANTSSTLTLQNNVISATTTAATIAYGIYSNGTFSINGDKVTSDAKTYDSYPLYFATATVGTVQSGWFKALGISNNNSQIVAPINTASSNANVKVQGGFFNDMVQLRFYVPSGYDIYGVDPDAPEHAAGYYYTVNDHMPYENVCYITEVSRGFPTLEEAFDYARNHSGTNYNILMIQPYILPAGNYSLPSNATLVVPYKATQTTAIGQTPKRRARDMEQIAENRLLTFATGANVDVAGKIETSGEQYVFNVGGTGYVQGPYGRLHLEEGSTVTLNSGARIYAWGYITGQGEIRVKNGAAVYEHFHMQDMKGSNDLSSNWLGNNQKTFPVNQYYIQNVEAPTKYYYGSQLLGASAFTTSATSTSPNSANGIKLVGTSSCLFNVDTDDEAAWVRKSYDPTTDRIIWETNSSASLGSLAISISGANMDTKDYILPITNNMTVHILSGLFKITQSSVMLPGAEIEIDKTATLRINAKDTKNEAMGLYLYDQAQWTTNASLPVYSPSWANGKCPRSNSYKNMKDAAVYVKGKIEVNGSIYTTAGGAAIYSDPENAGTILFNAAAGADKNIYKTYNASTAVTTTSAQLRNGGVNGSTFTATKGVAAAGDTYAYMDIDKDGNYEWTNLATVDACVVRDKSTSIYYAKPKDYVAITSATEDANHLFHSVEGDRLFIQQTMDAGCQWWEVTRVGETSVYHCATNDTYYEYKNGEWQEKVVHVTFYFTDPKNDAADKKKVLEVNYGAKPDATIVSNPSKTEDAAATYQFYGWKSSDTGTEYAYTAELEDAYEDMYYLPIFTSITKKYTITFKKAKDNTDVLVECFYGQSPTYDASWASSAQYDYEFTGWKAADNTVYPRGTALPVVTGATYYTAQWTNHTRSYNITWKNGEDVLEVDENQDYGTASAFNGTLPTKEADENFVYTFSGWRSSLTGSTYANGSTPTVGGETTYEAQYSTTPRYAVTFNNYDGTQLARTIYTQGATPAYDGLPTRKRDADGYFKFIGWKNSNGDDYAASATLPVVSKKETYTAQYDYVTELYLITLINIDGNGGSWSGKFGVGSTPFYDPDGNDIPDEPTKASADPRYTYVFTGWDPALETVTGAASYTAQFEQTDSKFTVSISVNNGEWGSVSKTSVKDVLYGQPVSVSGNTLTVGGTTITATPATEDEQYVYRFDHWESVPASVTGETEIQAVFTAYVATVTAGGTTTYHATVADAITTANGKTGAIVTMQHNASVTSEVTITATMTIDLNGKTVSSAVTTAATGVFKINASGKTVTITDSGTGGKIDHTANCAGYLYGISIIAGSLNIEGGHIYAENTKTTSNSSYRAYGINTQDNATAITISDDAIVEASRPGHTYVYGIYTQNACALTMMGGKFIANGATTGNSYVRGIYVKGTTTLTNATITAIGASSYAIYVGSGSTTINSGLYKGDGKVVYGSATVKGGYYSNNLDDLESKCAANYHVYETTDEDKASVGSDYNYKVVGAATYYYIDPATGEETSVPSASTPANPADYDDEDYTYGFSSWTDNGDGTYTASYLPKAERTYGTPLDIVDWTADAIVVNANGLKAAEGGTAWEIKYDGNYVYNKNTRTTDRRLLIDRNSEDADTYIVLKLKGTGGVERRNKYLVPHIYDASATLSGTEETSVVYVHTGATLTINANTIIKDLYVSPGANVVVSNGNTLTITGKLVLRTLPWQSAAIEGDVDAAQTFYTRIAPNGLEIDARNGKTTYTSSPYYQLALPYECNIADVRLSDGSTPVYNKTWLLKSYSESSRATKGATENNWVAVSNTGTDTKIKAHTGYEFYSNSTYYREYYFPVAPTDNKTVKVARSEGDNTNAGWNMICSPLMSNHQKNPHPEDITVSWLNEEGKYDQSMPDVIPPAIPFFYQAAVNNEKISFAGTNVTPSLAPRRRIAAADEPTRIQWIRLDVKDANGVGDETNIYSHPTRYEQYYQTGIDVAKQSLTAARARLYSSHAYGDMAFAGVSDELFEQGVALTLYSPAAQELTFSLRHNEWLNRLQYVWIIDAETGAMIDLLSSDYTAEVTEGTTYGRFYISGRFRTPQIATDIDEVQGDEVRSTKAQKVLIEEKIYIMVGDKLYDATGKLVKGK